MCSEYAHRSFRDVWEARILKLFSVLNFVIGRTDHHKKWV